MLFYEFLFLLYFIIFLHNLLKAFILLPSKKLTVLTIAKLLILLKEEKILG